MYLLVKSLLVIGLFAVGSYGTYKVIDTPIANENITQGEGTDSKNLDSQISQISAERTQNEKSKEKTPFAKASENIRDASHVTPESERIPKK